jgi:hypothetical protein
MPRTLDPFRFLLVAVAGWMNHPHAIEYLQEEKRILRAQLGGTRRRLTNDQRRSLADKAKLLGSRMLVELATIVTPESCSHAATTLGVKSHQKLNRKVCGSLLLYPLHQTSKE